MKHFSCDLILADNAMGEATEERLPVLVACEGAEEPLGLETVELAPC